MAKLAGRPIEDLVGRPVREGSASTVELGLFEHYRAVADGGEPWHQQLTSPTTAQVWEVKIARVEAGVVAVSYLDVTEQVDQQEQLTRGAADIRAAADRTAALQAVPTALVAASTLAEVYAAMGAAVRPSAGSRPDLQQALLPAMLPKLAGARHAVRYLPGTRGADVGGDWYDVIDLASDTAAIVIGDVAGHSPRAAERWASSATRCTPTLHRRTAKTSAAADTNNALTAASRDFPPDGPSHGCPQDAACRTSVGRWTGQSDACGTVRSARSRA